MKRALLIAEKPSVAREIQSVYETFKADYEYDIDFTNAFGHLCGLAEPDTYTPDWGQPWRSDVLPMIPDAKNWHIIAKNQEQINFIRSLIDENSYDYIINACDSAREGCLIFYFIYDYLKLDIPVLRLWVDDTAASTIKEGMYNLRSGEDYSGLRAAAYIRAYLDWLIGFNFSRAATLCTKQKIAIGRVETPTLAMIVNRENEIMNFTPEDYFEVETSFVTNKGESYHGFLTQDGSSSVQRFKTDGEAGEVCSKILRTGFGTVKDYRYNDESIKAPELYNLADLQKDASKQFGYAPDKTLALAQALYEKHKILSYPRTDSRYLTKNITEELPDRLKAISDIPEISKFVSAILSNVSEMTHVYSDRKYVDDAKIADHHALIPTKTHVDMSKLSKDEANVFLLVAIRFTAIFMPPNINSKSVIITESAGYLFYTSGKVLKQKGWRELYPATGKDIELPPVEIEEEVKVGGDLGKLPKASAVLPKQTQPPKRYTDASILTAMETCGKDLTDEEFRKVLRECNGLGTSATRANILVKLEKFGWVKKEAGKGKGKAKVLIPTEQGKALIKTLEGSSVVKAELTATWEKELKMLESDVSLQGNVYNHMLKYIRDTTAEFSTSLKPVQYSKESLGTCPDCGGKVFSGKKAFYCENVLKKKILEDGSEEKLCRFGFNKTYSGTSISDSDVKALLSQGKTKTKKFKWKSGKTGETALVLVPRQIKTTDVNGNTVYVEDTEHPGHTIGLPSWKNTSVCLCPYCGKDIYSGKNYYICQGYKNGCTGGSRHEGFVLSKEWYHARFTEKDIANLVQNGKSITKQMTWKNGNTSSAKVRFNQEECKYELDILEDSKPLKYLQKIIVEEMSKENEK